MPTVIGPVVRAVSTRTKYSTYVTPRHGFPCDVEIGGLRFLYDPTADTPMSRRTADFKKQQFDNESEPGEQTLTGWWLRSQPSFHGGAGILYQENYGYDNTFKYAPTIRFRDSMGVDPWTEGQVSLLPEVNKAINSTGTPVARGGLDGTTPVLFLADGLVLSRFDGTTSSAITAGNTGTILDVATSATSYFVADSVGIYQGTLSGGTGSKVWTLSSATSAKLGWVKQRLVAGVNNSLYELVGGSPPTLPTALYTHPASSWTWTSIVAGPAAIYASGYAGGSSSILAFELTSTGTMPVLTSAVTVAELPQGEIVQSLFAYLGTFLVIGTNKGVRIGTVDASSGTVTYGPLTITSPNGSVRDLVGKDRFVYAAATSGLADGSSGLWRIDLGTEVTDGRFAWANDLSANTTGRVRSVTLLGDQVAFTVDSAGLFLQHSSNLVPSGWIRTGRIRYRTLEPKLFKYVRLRTNPLSGAIGISAITDGDSELPVASITSPGETDHDDCALPGNLGGQESLGLKFILTRNTSTVNTGPVLRSFQLKALPGTKRQRQLILPLLCYDYEEQSGGGQRFGYIGYARDRLMALEAIENLGDAVIFQDFQGGRVLAELAVIDQLQFDQSFPPERGHGLGGRLIVVLRTIV